MTILKRISALALALGLFLGVFAPTASAAEELVYGVGFVNATSLNLRAEASTTSSILATAPRGSCVVVLSKEEQWYKVSYDQQEGYMHGDYLQISTQEGADLGFGHVNGTEVNLRTGPGTDFTVVGRASKNESCQVLGISSGWYKVLWREKTCYIRSDYLTLGQAAPEDAESDQSPAGSGTVAASTEVVTGDGILEEAKKYLGVRYVNGGASPSGFDCSGFVYYVLRQCGHAPSRILSEMVKRGTEVEKDALEVGDVVFFANTYGRGISHVGIFSGGGQFIHAPNSRSTVSYSDLTSGYWSDHYYTARRMG
ncbi:MAG: C40 family peptidase [Oscillospiraceae bacterium]|nr:C40 family peptidase [Oscillospiraceae bacterium]